MQDTDTVDLQFDSSLRPPRAPPDKKDKNEKFISCYFFLPLQSFFWPWANERTFRFFSFSFFLRTGDFFFPLWFRERTLKETRQESTGSLIRKEVGWNNIMTLGGGDIISSMSQLV